MAGAGDDAEEQGLDATMDAAEQRAERAAAAIAARKEKRRKQEQAELDAALMR